MLINNLMQNENVFEVLMQNASNTYAYVLAIGEGTVVTSIAIQSRFRAKKKYI